MPEWYQDPVGVWTIGWGTTEHVQGVSHPHSPADPITKEQGRALLRKHLKEIEASATFRALRKKTTQGQWDALVSLAYNIGVRRLGTSTLYQHVLHGRTAKASEQFGRWIYAGGKVWDGLVKRRAEERALFDERDPRALGLSPVRPWEMQELADPESYILDILERHTL